LETRVGIRLERFKTGLVTMTSTGRLSINPFKSGTLFLGGRLPAIRLSCCDIMNDVLSEETTRWM